MTKKPIIAIFLLCLLALTSLGTVFAQTAQVGVSKGNQVKYDVKFLWSSTDPTATAPSYLVDQNQTQYYQATIASVTETLIEIKTNWKFNNGTDVTDTEQVDVSTGNGGSILVYAANLNAMDKLYPLASYPWTVTETVNRAYQSGPRATNHITENRTDLGTDYIYSYVDLYFDKQTGLLVEALMQDVYSATPDQTFGRHVVIQESNVWAIPEFPSALAIGALMAVGCAVAVVYKAKRLRTSN